MFQTTKQNMSINPHPNGSKWIDPPIWVDVFPSFDHGTIVPTWFSPWPSGAGMATRLQRCGGTWHRNGMWITKHFRTWFFLAIDLPHHSSYCLETSGFFFSFFEELPENTYVSLRFRFPHSSFLFLSCIAGSKFHHLPPLSAMSMGWWPGILLVPLEPKKLR